jgi:protein-tyrosine phosphatase
MKGKRVLLHCVQAKSRTPTVAALYGARVAGISPMQALADLQRMLPAVRPNALFMRVLKDAREAADIAPDGARPRLPANVRGC